MICYAVNRPPTIPDGFGIHGTMLSSLSFGDMPPVSMPLYGELNGGISFWIANTGLASENDIVFRRSK